MLMDAQIKTDSTEQNHPSGSCFTAQPNILRALSLGQNGQGEENVRSICVRFKCVDFVPPVETPRCLWNSSHHSLHCNLVLVKPGLGQCFDGTPSKIYLLQWAVQ